MPANKLETMPRYKGSGKTREESHFNGPIQTTETEGGMCSHIAAGVYRSELMLRPLDFNEEPARSQSDFLAI